MTNSKTCEVWSRINRTSWIGWGTTSILASQNRSCSPEWVTLTSWMLCSWWDWIWWSKSTPPWCFVLVGRASTSEIDPTSLRRYSRTPQEGSSSPKSSNYVSWVTGSPSVSVSRCSARWWWRPISERCVPLIKKQIILFLLHPYPRRPSSWSKLNSSEFGSALTTFVGCCLDACVRLYAWGCRRMKLSDPLLYLLAR